ncbi:polymorphic toxin-type HINT domain-containing protein [Chitinivorax sp. B]|uniref:polymorphic toxin-type HINT domain-containing protein n=1 Tax=Chitinivorax sp. B TaxID=2502235 RepID=UPI0010F9409C|nr:polymorphic toxin-type HINT domain-containing protein [Chitinivorax sp. B]
MSYSTRIVLLIALASLLGQSTLANVPAYLPNPPATAAAPAPKPAATKPKTTPKADSRAAALAAQTSKQLVDLILLLSTDDEKPPTPGGGSGGSPATDWDISALPELPAISGTSLTSPGWTDAKPTAVQPVRYAVPVPGNTVGSLPGKLSVDSGGAAVYEIPLALPRGVKGLVPELALRYNSHAGNGPLGMGWTLGGASAVTRCAKTIAQDAQVGAVEFDTHDGFCLDGERLIPTGVDTATGWNEYRTALEGFSRIVSIGPADRPTFFQVYTRDGRILDYGSSPDSQIDVNVPGMARPGSGASRRAVTAGNPIHTWALNLRRDRDGNTIHYQYQKDRNGGQYRLANVSYAGNRVIFDYAKRPDTQFAKVGTAALWNDYRISTISIYAAGFSEAITQYTLQYHPSEMTAVSRLESIQQCGIDPTSRSKTCYNGTRFDWSNPQPTKLLVRGTDDILLHSNWITLPSTLQYVKQPGGPTFTVPRILSDVLYGFNVAPGLKEYKFSSISQGIDGRMYFGYDVLKQGALQSTYQQCSDQKILQSRAGWSGEHSTLKSVLTDGEQLTQCQDPSPWGTPVFNISAANVKAFDQTEHYLAMHDAISGNLQVEACCTGTRGSPYTVLPPAGRKLRSFLLQEAPTGHHLSAYLLDDQGDVWTRPIIFAEPPSNVWQAVVTGRKVTDFRVEDGRVLISNQAGELWLRGQGRAEFRKLANNVQSFQWGASKLGVLVNGSLYTAPVNEVDELIRTNRHITSTFWKAQAGEVRSFFLSRGGIYVTDSHGTLHHKKDTAADRFYQVASHVGLARPGSLGSYDRYGDGARNYETLLVGSSSVDPDKIVRIVDGLGAESKISYDLTDNPQLYQDPLPVVYPSVRPTKALTVVATIERSNGIGGFLTHRYSYRAGRFDTKGRGFLGFHQVMATDPLGVDTLTHYGQGWPYTGAVMAVKKQKDRNLLSEDTFTYTVNNLTPGRVHRYANGSQSHTYDPLIANRLLISKKTEYNQVDEYGNVGQTIVTTKSLDAANQWQTSQTVTTTQYTNQPGMWLLGLPTQVSTTVTGFDGDSKTTVSRSSYYPDQPHRLKTVDSGGTAAGFDVKHKLTTQLTYDGVGNVTQTDVTGFTRLSDGANPTPVIETRSSRQTYDTSGRFVIGLQHALDIATNRPTQEQRGYDTRFADSLNGVIDRNHLTLQQASYDALGRIVSETLPDGRLRRYQYQGCTSSCPATGSYQIVISETARPNKTLSLDALGRELRTEVIGFDGAPVWQDKQYNALGQLDGESRPYRPGAMARWTRHSYDLLGRLQKVTLPNAGTLTHSYDGLASTETKTVASNNQQTVVSRKLSNGLGQIVQIEQTKVDGKLTQRFAYDPLGTLAKVTDTKGNVIAMTIDALGRKVATIDPDMGRWEYDYNAFGELIAQRDANYLQQPAGQQPTRLHYDALGRLVKRTERDLTSMWEYDTAANGIDKLAKVSADNQTARSLSYDRLGRVQTLTDQLDTTYTLTNSYDPATGLLASRSYPNGFTLRYQYTPSGYLQAIREADSSKLYWQANTTNAAGQVTQFLLGNGHTVNRNYYETDGLLQAVMTRNAAGQAIQDFGFEFDQLGNLKKRVDYSLDPAANKPLNLAETFDYDRLNRLTQAILTNAGQSIYKFYSYDDLGNLVSKSDFSYHYVYGNGRPHAVSMAYALNAPTDSTKATLYRYDDNGNLTDELIGGSPVRNASYFASNLPKAVQRFGSTAASVSFVYDAERLRVKETASGPTGNSTLYHLRPETHGGAHYEKETKGNTTTHHVYLYAGSELVGKVSQQAGNANKTAHYFLTDHLGSIAVITDDAGAVIERLAYDPFGKRRLPSGPDQAGLNGTTTRHGFTGHDHLDGVELVHMNGRIYDPRAGRFMTPDPNVFYPDNSQDFNRYAYVHNNPLSATDPSGFALMSLSDTFLSGHAFERTLSDALFRQIDRQFNNQLNQNFSGNAGYAYNSRGGSYYASSVITTSNAYSERSSGSVTFASQAQPAQVYGASNSVQATGSAISDFFGSVKASAKEVWADSKEWARGNWQQFKNDANFAAEHPSLDFLNSMPATAGASGFGNWLAGLGKGAGTAGQIVNSCCCFPAGTPVETEFGSQPIEQIKVGQRVYARDPQTGATALKPVTQLMTTQGKPLYQLVTRNLVTGAIEQMNVTDNHPYWVQGQGWVDAAALKPYMVLDSLNQGALLVVSLTSLNRVETTYNFTVADFHTYFAGKQKAFVHNNGNCACARAITTSVEVLSNSKLSHINGTIGELRGYQNAIENLGHIGIAAPGKATARGADFITFSVDAEKIFVWDAKYRGPNGIHPTTLSPEKLKRWMPEVRSAIENLPDGPLKDAATSALQKGNVGGAIFKWPQ